MFFVVVSLVLASAILSILMYSSVLQIGTMRSRIVFAGSAVVGCFAILFVSRIADPSPLLVVVYFIAWIIGGTMLYAFIFSPLGCIAFILRKRYETFAKGMVLFIISAAFVCTVVGIFQRSMIVTRTYTLPTDKEALVGKRIIILADTQFNIANTTQFARRITRKLVTLDPSYIVLPGDVFDGARLDMTELSQEFRIWSDLAPTFMSPGNHEEYGDYHFFITTLVEQGIRVLENEATVFDGITFIGFKYYGREKTEQGSSIIRSVLDTTDPVMPRIVLHHEPRYMDIFEEARVDVVIMGHTHGGQFWPMRYVVQQIYGDFWYGKNIRSATTFITSSGLGLAAFPSRLFMTPEIVIIEFTQKDLE